MNSFGKGLVFILFGFFIIIIILLFIPICYTNYKNVTVLCKKKNNKKQNLKRYFIVKIINKVFKNHVKVLAY